MAKKKDQETMGSETTPGTEIPMTASMTFEVDEQGMFMPTNGEEETVTIKALPAEGSSKYLCESEGGNIVPINPCYLRKL